MATDERRLGDILDRGRATGEVHLTDTRTAILVILADAVGHLHPVQAGGARREG